MHCLDSKKELGSRSRTAEAVYILHNPLWPLCWRELKSIGGPSFFSSRNAGLDQPLVTHPDDGSLFPSQRAPFALLKTLIENGEGPDATGVRWKIVSK